MGKQSVISPITPSLQRRSGRDGGCRDTERDRETISARRSSNSSTCCPQTSPVRISICLSSQKKSCDHEAKPLTTLSPHWLSTCDSEGAAKSAQCPSPSTVLCSVLAVRLSRMVNFPYSPNTRRFTAQQMPDFAARSLSTA
ncbi:hypothetical protein JOB18_037491 [Solea senegalensis]|uniref:Uncharacterized protein n=1 Tax=Solea senegalensis TaxID=28829 RepID=A0AAV6S4S5_SOLSE|nr:hypothetical protein JOB18_037491 [Solea senegalensis]